MSKVTKEMMQTLPKIAAIDFDGTLVDDEFPNIGKIKKETLKLCKTLKSKGVKLILWTCRDGEALTDALKFCWDNGLVFDAVNENIPELQAMFKNDTRKVFADIYLDDKSVHIEDLSLCAAALGVH